MKRLTLLLLVLVFFPMLSISCAAEKPERSKGQGVGGQEALPFTLKDLKGANVSLSDFSGKVKLLEFTTTWCPYCITIIPDIKKAYNGYKDKGLEVIAIYVNEPHRKVAELVDKYEIPYTVLLDASGDVASDYKLLGVPTIVIVDKAGMIRYKGHKFDAKIIEEIIKG